MTTTVRLRFLRPSPSRPQVSSASATAAAASTAAPSATGQAGDEEEGIGQAPTSPKLEDQSEEKKVKPLAIVSVTL